VATSGCRRRIGRRKAILDAPLSQGAPGPRAVGDPGHARTHRVREPGGPAVACDDEHRRPHCEVHGRTAMMHDRGTSDSLQTFNFLGFTHACRHTRKGQFTVLRQTVRQRLQVVCRILPCGHGSAGQSIAVRLRRENASDTRILPVTINHDASSAGSVPASGCTRYRPCAEAVRPEHR
jgi:hypothetical protein